jgi:hypothetical protein
MALLCGITPLVAVVVVLALVAEAHLEKVMVVGVMEEPLTRVLMQVTAGLMEQAVVAAAAAYINALTAVPQAVRAVTD